ncbi:haloacid dehalogenase-like hydrolase [Actinomadura sp. LOL_016]|uniref:haloacid dehalogenase-like hydrolase n=1 Tax=unclassified Actinomadura TaxID=2626254 RepID=UPI003A7F85EA
MTALVLWDIDHTLLSIGPLSGRAVPRNVREGDRTAVRAARGHDQPHDLATTSETLRLHGITPTEVLLASFADALAAGFDGNRDRLTVQGRALHGAHDALQALAGRDDVVQSVLTGNAEPIARCKLAAFDLDRYVDFNIGAYGMDGAERPPLVALARHRAQHKYGMTFDASATVLIGDTPNGRGRAKGRHPCHLSVGVSMALFHQVGQAQPTSEADDGQSRRTASSAPVRLVDLLVMGGRELWEYLQTEYPGISDTKIANLAGVTSNAVSGWKFYDRQPEYHTVRRLHQGLCNAYRYSTNNEIRLLLKAGYPVPADPEIKRLRRFTKEWAEITAALVQDEPHVKWQASKLSARSLRRTNRISRSTYQQVTAKFPRAESPGIRLAAGTG